MLDLLVHVSSYVTPGANAGYAAELAARLDAFLTGVFVAEPVLPLPTAGMPSMVSEIYAVAAQVAEEARAADGDFRRFAAARGATHARWQVAEGPLAAVLASAANWHDLLVLEASGSALSAGIGTLGEVVLTCGLPCLVVPDQYDRAAALDTIVVAANGTPESIRAAHAALPLLKRARRVELVLGVHAPVYATIGWQPAPNLEEHLRRHGLPLVKRTLDASDDRAGDAILAAAAELSADLLVMGAYGRSRFSEWLLGGATRQVLEHARLPVLLRH